MRLFAALEVPVEVREELHAWWESANSFFAPSIWRDVPMRNWHLTMAFFGEVKGTDIDDLTEALNACANRQLPLQLAIRDFGAFPSLVRPRVFWAGVGDKEKGKGDLARLARCCRLAGRATVRKRSAKDEPFRGHVTLARASQIALPIELGALQALPVLAPLTWVADSLRLVQSTLHPEGARYRILEEFPLGE